MKPLSAADECLTGGTIVTTVDLDGPIDPLKTGDFEIAPTKAKVLVRLHGTALDFVEVPVGPGGLSADELRLAVELSAATAIEAHRRLDRLGSNNDAIRAAGDAGVSPCQLARRSLLSNAPTLTVIIPTRDRPERLARCLESILACEYPADRLTLLIVDNKPATGATKELIELFASTHPVRYLREDSPGSASARNAGVLAADGDLLVFTDDDVVVDRLWLVEIARAFLSNPSVACVSGSLLPLELRTQAQLWFEEYGGFSRGFSPRLFDNAENAQSDNPLYPFTAGVFGTGNNLAFRRDDLLEIGLFDPALGNGTPALGGVDSEVLLRAVLSEKKIAYTPTALVWHEHRSDYGALRSQIFNYGCGLVAYMLKTVTTNKRAVPAFLRRLPRGLAFALSRSSPKNSHKTASYPRALTIVELLGMLYGPVGYWRSRRKYGPHRPYDAR